MTSTDTTKSPTPLQQYYDEAFQFYTQGDYRRAIMKWTEILKENPEQQSAQTMILKAREQLETLTAQYRRRIFVSISSGNYKQALLSLQALLDQDPSDPRSETLQDRLQAIIKITPTLTTNDKSSRMARKGVQAYLTIPPDLILAHNALRYSAELSPNQKIVGSLLNQLLTTYPELNEKDVITPGMSLIEFKQAVAKHQIYDAKYHQAVATLDEILALEPNNLTALKRLGSAYFCLNKMSDARKAWKAALKISPDDKSLKKFLAKTNVASGKIQKTRSLGNLP